MSVSLKASRFKEANRKSPVVYGSVDEHLFTYRLSDGSTWTFPRREAQSIGHPRWAHLVEKDRRVLLHHRSEEHELLKRVLREAELEERYPER